MNENAKGRGSGQGHPLPDSEEARQSEIPEHMVREKGHGDDDRAAVQPQGDPVAPDGESYGIERGRQARQAQGRGHIDDPGR